MAMENTHPVFIPVLNNTLPAHEAASYLLAYARNPESLREVSGAHAALMLNSLVEALDGGPKIQADFKHIKNLCDALCDEIENCV